MANGGLKTILVHLADDDHHRARLDVALRLARQHGAHVVALFITFPVGMPPAIAGRGASAVFVQEARSSARRKAEALRREFDSLCREAAVEQTWIVEDGEQLEALARHAHVADLTIVSQSSEGSYLEDRVRPRLAEEITLLSGSPVLLLPRVDPVPGFAEHVMVAWHPNREAVRALRDALPFLRAAPRVSVVAVGEAPARSAGEAEVVAHLRRHGVAAEPVRVPERDGVGATLLATARERGCDMLVMGAYGRSRLRELLLGGATRHVFRNTHVPVLMSH